MTATQALGWALVHSLWQCAFAAAGLASLLGTLPSRAARIRYACATATLVLTVALPLATALSLYGASPWPAPTLAGPAVLVLRLAARVRATLEPVLPAIVVLWVAGVGGFSLRLAAGGVGAGGPSVVGARAPPPPPVGGLRP